jgi:outer membrane protein
MNMNRFVTILLLSISTVVIGQNNTSNIWDLPKCIEYAQENNIQINKSKLNIERVEQDELNSKASLYPSLNAGLNQGFNFGTNAFTGATTRGSQQFGNYNANLSFDVFRGLSKTKQVKQSQAELSVSKLETDRMKNDISLNISTAYLNILFQKELLKVAVEQVDITQLQVDRIEKLLNAGGVPKSDLLDIKAQLANDELTKVQVENAMYLAYVDLVQLMQLPVEDQVGFDIEVPNLDTYEEQDFLITPGEVYTASLTVMPEVQRDQRAIESSELTHSVVKGDYWPRLIFSAGAGTRYNGNFTEDFTDPDSPVVPWGTQFNDNLNYSTTLTLQIPIFNGLAVRTNTQKAEISVRDAQYQYEQTKTNLEQSIQKAYYDARAARQKYFASQIAVDALVESFAYSQLKFEEGVINQVEYNQVKTNLTKAQSDLVQAKYDYIFRLKILDFYQGKPLTF